MTTMTPRQRSARVDVERSYFEWLYEKIAGRESYRKLCQHLHRKVFYWTIPNDDNRQEEGYDLRHQFMENYENEFAITIPADHPFLNEPVSVFEVLIALSDRMDYQLYNPNLPPRNTLWFQEMISNLGISDLVDNRWSDVAAGDVDRVVETLLDRTYDENGNGSLFPLDNPRDDLTQVELWYQLMAYLMEKYPT